MREKNVITENAGAAFTLGVVEVEERAVAWIWTGVEEQLPHMYNSK